eukprot:gnl/TRDRNA2_/TRDRNA2_43566_c0_seq1.p1 gnl/TRDRNA2_/TRDRNA2_43566_c0~~gnl/TRDRNA2_/TRDRNA2_43566_c0_seq1.p1  ORF type:complete len:414 (-),score=72.41 gnl/TRDRNA2_/TRDRNA2_43566_c0_seq1:58-1299(-)
MLSCCFKITSYCFATLVAAIAIVFGLAWAQWPYRCCEDIKLLPLEAGSPDLCELNGDANMQDLDEKGYTVVHNFVTDEDRLKLLDLMDKLPEPPFDGDGKGFKRFDWGLLWNVTPEMGWRTIKLLGHIENETDIRIMTDRQFGHEWLISPEFFVSDSTQSMDQTVVYPWHQDHGQWYDHGELHHYLNFYVMLEKPSRTEAGVSVVPFDLMKKRAPRMHELTIGEGASSFLVDDSPGAKEGMLFMVNRENERRFTMNWNIDRIACTPALGSGDLLVFRGDVMHRTQPHKSKRKSLSMHTMITPPSSMTLSKLLTGGYHKYYFLANGHVRYPLLAGQILKRDLGASFMERLASIGISDTAWFTRFFQAGLLYRKHLRFFRGLLGTFTDNHEFATMSIYDFAYKASEMSAADATYR